MRKLFFASIFTVGIMSSFVFAIIILIFIFTHNVNIWLAIFLTIIINFILWLIGPKMSDFVNKFFYKATFLSEKEFTEQHPSESEIIKKISVQYNFPFPKIGIISDENPTAFTYGSARFNSRIILTKGIFTFLNTNETRAVLAHELGHIVNRDVITMTISSTFVQLLYEIYYTFKRKESDSDSSNNGDPFIFISFLSYIFYIISTYLLLFLSRTREYYADMFSAKNTNAQDLSSALIKISYGIIATADNKRTARLLGSTRHLGIVDTKNVKYQSVGSYITNPDLDLVSEVMVFDIVNPWAKISELSSTHPLTGKRLYNLETFSKNNNQQFLYDISGAKKRLNVNKSKLYCNFFLDILIKSLPFLFALLTIIFLPKYLFLATIAFGLILRNLYKFPNKTSPTTTILDEMRNPYASPVRGKLINISGSVIGKGIPGYIFSEDMMYQDDTGLILLDYKSSLGLIGNINFSIKKLKTLFKIPSVANGWFFRDMKSAILLRYLKINKDNKIFKSYPLLWRTIFAILLICSSILLYVFKDYFINIIPISVLYL